MELVENIKENSSFYKENDTDKMYGVDFPDMDGWLAVSFDKKKFYFSIRIIPRIFRRKKRLSLKKKNLSGPHFLRTVDNHFTSPSIPFI